MYARRLRGYSLTGYTIRNASDETSVFQQVENQSSKDTDLVMVRVADGKTAFCVGPVALFAVARDRGVGFGAECPKGSDTKPTAVVNTDAPWLGYTGWGILLLGFFLQLFSIEEPMLTKDDLRLLRKARKIIENSN